MSAESYMTAALGVLDQVRETQLGAIAAAGRKAAEVIAAGGVIHVFGTGHSHMVAEEVYYRAGGLLTVNAILEPSVMLHEGAAKSGAMERTPGVARVLFATQPVRAGDLMVVVSNAGRNAMPVEMAELARRHGLYVVAITSLAHSRSVAAQTESGLRLFEAADLVIDNCGVPGDAILAVPGSPVRACATSTLAGVLIIQAIVAEAVAVLAGQGTQPPILMSGNLDGANEYNRRLVQQVSGRLPQIAAELAAFGAQP